mmetsp:Transcript_9071/g.28528  ORF Transcript_9071/g.28528 Transcript_9071/m.28528 type:complete len:210 (-) Transcript_9071:13-642(-)
MKPHVLDVRVDVLHLLRLSSQLVGCERADLARVVHHLLAAAQRLDRLHLHLRRLLYELRGRQRVRVGGAPAEHVLPAAVVLQRAEQVVVPMQRRRVLRDDRLPLGSRLGRRLHNLKAQRLQQLLRVVQPRGDVPQLLPARVPFEMVDRVERRADVLLHADEVRLVGRDILQHLRVASRARLPAAAEHRGADPEHRRARLPTRPSAARPV